MPTGTLASTILRKKGPLQTEEETKRFFDTIGVSSDASLPEISEAYEHAVHTLPSDMHKVLEESFDEFLRKQFVQAFEHMESFMERGQRGWEEYWDPTKDAFGNPVNMTSEAAELKDQIIADRMPPELDVTKFREYWKKNNTRFSTMLQEINMPSRLRLTSNFGGRLARASIFMLPVMLLGLFPQYSSLSLGIQGLLASGFIFKGDREIILKREQESSTSIATAEPIARSTSSRTLVTSLVLCVHSLIGIGAAKLFGYYTSILEYLPEQLLRVASINLQFFIAALLWDTSDITQSTYVKQEEKRMSKLTKYLPKDIPEI
ncbi:molecular chaperone protein, putative [Babesia ovis]|uniref:Molecular chaperone protein, putative n=1 Tax=Babesia ovis TaxID=5869 RepID=A0A9W5WWH6_BABOV|nr:molecular chaperone protein, putative [Babesia ovis]